MSPGVANSLLDHMSLGSRIQLLFQKPKWPHAYFAGLLCVTRIQVFNLDLANQIYPLWALIQELVGGQNTFWCGSRSSHNIQFSGAAVPPLVSVSSSILECSGCPSGWFQVLNLAGVWAVPSFLSSHMVFESDSIAYLAILEPTFRSSSNFIFCYN